MNPPSADDEHEIENNHKSGQVLDENQTPKKLPQQITSNKDFDLNETNRLDENMNCFKGVGQRFEIEIENNGNKEEKDQTELFFVEKRYCTVCNLEQPFRSKHCKDCDRCVAKYDHHCPWLGKFSLSFFFAY